MKLVSTGAQKRLLNELCTYMYQSVKVKTRSEQTGRGLDNVADCIQLTQRITYQLGSLRVWRLGNRTNNSNCEILI
jgi:hypothetical protein